MLFPTICLALEHQLRDRVDALLANVSAFNRYVQEQWGFGQDGRIFAAAWLSLVDAEAAANEAEWLVDHGVRVVNLRAGPVYGRSPADPAFDSVWAQLEEAAVVVSFHGGDAGLQDIYTPQWGEQPGLGSFMWSPFQMAMAFVERAAADTLSALVLHNLFGRFPRIRVLSVENGAFWVPELLERMDRSTFIARGEGLGGPLNGKPSDIFQEHVYLTPYERDDIPGLVRAVGADRQLFGSDWPHPTGLANPADFADRIDGLTASEMDLPDGWLRPPTAQSGRQLSILNRDGAKRSGSVDVGQTHLSLGLSRSLNFCTLPLVVMGNSPTKRMCLGIL